MLYALKASFGYASSVSGLPSPSVSMIIGLPKPSVLQVVFGI